MRKNPVNFFLQTIAILLLITGIYGCSAKNNLNNAADYTYRVSLGQATPEDAQKYIEEVFKRYNFPIEQYRIESRIYFETGWLQRPPDDSETHLESVQTKIIITSRSGKTMSSGVRVYSIALIANTEAIQDTAAGWKRVPVSDYSKSMIDEMATELRDRFSSRFWGF